MSVCVRVYKFEDQALRNAANDIEAPTQGRSTSNTVLAPRPGNPHQGAKGLPPYPPAQIYCI